MIHYVIIFTIIDRPADKLQPLILKNFSLLFPYSKAGIRFCNNFALIR